MQNRILDSEKAIKSILCFASTAGDEPVHSDAAKRNLTPGSSKPRSESIFIAPGVDQDK